MSSEYVTLLITFVNNASFFPSLNRYAFTMRRSSVPESVFVFPNSDSSRQVLYGLLDIDARILGQIADVEQIAGGQVNE